MGRYKGINLHANYQYMVTSDDYIYPYPYVILAYHKHNYLVILSCSMPTFYSKTFCVGGSKKTTVLY